MQLKHNYKNILTINHSYLNTKVLIDKIIQQKQHY